MLPVANCLVLVTLIEVISKLVNYLYYLTLILNVMFVQFFSLEFDAVEKDQSSRANISKGLKLIDETINRYEKEGILIQLKVGFCI